MLKKILIGAAAALSISGLTLAGAAPAAAEDFHGHGGGHDRGGWGGHGGWGGRGYYGRRGYDYGAAVLGAGILGVALGSSYAHPYYGAPPGYYAGPGYWGYYGGCRGYWRWDPYWGRYVREDSCY